MFERNNFCGHDEKASEEPRSFFVGTFLTSKCIGNASRGPLLQRMGGSTDNIPLHNEILNSDSLLGKRRAERVAVKFRSKDVMLVGFTRSKFLQSGPHLRLKQATGPLLVPEDLETLSWTSLTLLSPIGVPAKAL
jgi:hypothetical protein